MASYTIRMELDNAAFTDGNEGVEVARILRTLADKCERADEATDARISDYNGNNVGQAERISD